MGHKLEHYVEIYDIICYDMGEDYEDNINTTSWRPRYYWIIIEEYIKTGVDGHEYGDAIRYFDNIVKPQNHFNFTKQELIKLIQDYIESTKKDYIEYEMGEYDEDEDMELFYLKIIVDLHLELQKYKIVSVIDLKGRHLGYSEKDDHYKYFDLRLERGIDKDIKNIKRLN